MKKTKIRIRLTEFQERFLDQLPETMTLTFPRGVGKK